jgi:DUF1680 family protein
MALTSRVSLFLMVSALLLAGLPAAVAQTSEVNSRGVIDVSKSPYAKLHSVPVHAVKMGEGFWLPRMKTNVERSIPSLLELMEQHGIVDNFRRLSGHKKVDRRGPLYTDSDLYKWMEAVALVLQSGDDPKLRATLDSLVDEVLAAQEPSGYLNTYWVEERAANRFTEQWRGHELYCLGHLLQAGIAYYRATGNRKLLDGGIKFANYMVENFGPEKRPALTGHPELEMAMVELYRTTGERKYLDFAGYLLSGVERERLKLTDQMVEYMFSGSPFTSRTQFEGHAVRAMYASCGATDYYMETGDPAYWKTLSNLWQDMYRHKLYITGGVGSRAAGEAFGEPYELPNSQAYTESCAAIANMMWNWRMLAATGEARFMDVIERALYNGINSGMSLDGTLYCYRNPLESSGEKIRNPWYDTTCCPPNLQRIFASLPGYLYSTSAEGLYVHMFHNSTLDWRLENGTPIRVTQETKYPWEGDVTITVSPASASDFTLFVRIPAWADGANVAVNGKSAPGVAKQSEYFTIKRHWQAGDKVRLLLPMTPRLILANERVRENVGRVAVERGPLVYCLEQHDYPGQESIFDATLPVSSAPAKGFRSEFLGDKLGGIVVLKHRGIEKSKPLTDEPLYRTLETAKRSVAGHAVELTFIPYYAWANREPDSMQVWIPYARVSGEGGN